MMVAVCLNHEAMFGAVEVQDVGAKLMLAAKLGIRHAAVTEMPPETLFRRGAERAKGTTQFEEGDIPLSASVIHHHDSPFTK